MKIAILSGGSHPDTIGGIQTFNRSIKEMLSSDQVIILTYPTKNKKIFSTKDVIEIGKDSLIFKIINKIFFNKIRKYLIEKELKKIRPDVCIVSSPRELIFIENIETKKILVQHANYPRYISLYYNNNNKLIEKSKKEVDIFICLSPQSLERFKDELKFPKEKLKVIRHSCEIEPRTTTKFKNKTLIMIGRIINEIKAYDLVIKSMKKLPDYNLNIYGEGIDKEKLEEFVKRNKIENVYFKGSSNRISEILDESGIFVMSSNTEGYPLTAIEAINRKLPLVIRNSFDSAKDIVDGNGILLDNQWNEEEFIEAVKEIYNNYEKYSENNLKLLSKYKKEIIKKEWEKILKEVINCEKK